MTLRIAPEVDKVVNIRDTKDRKGETHTSAEAVCNAGEGAKVEGAGEGTAAGLGLVKLLPGQCPPYH